MFRAPGTGVFLDASRDTTPLALRANVEHNHMLHETRGDRLDRVAQRPARAGEERVKIDELGYERRRHLPRHRALRLPGRHRHPATCAARARSSRATSTSSDASYFLSRITIVAGRRAGMARWRKKLFWRSRATPPARSATSTCPTSATVVMGAHMEL